MQETAAYYADGKTIFVQETKQSEMKSIFN